MSFGEGYHIGYTQKIRNLEEKIKKLKSKTTHLKKLLCPECKKKFEKIFGET